MEGGIGRRLGPTPTVSDGVGDGEKVRVRVTLESVKRQNILRDVIDEVGRR